jgi:hypothetical protein
MRKRCLAVAWVTVVHFAMATPLARAQEPAPAAPEVPKEASAAPSGGAIVVPLRTKAVQFVAPPGVVFYRVDGGDSARICLPPCEVRISGAQRLALSLNGDSPVTAPEQLSLSPGSVIEGDYRSASSKRTTGVIVLALGLPAGIATAAAGAGLLQTEYGDDAWVGVTTIVAGAAMFLVSLIGGIVLTATSDEAHVFERISDQ